MERLGKKPAYIYAKDFSLSQVLGNLQAYKIVTGQITEEVGEASGRSKEEVYGDLIRNAGKSRKRKGHGEHDTTHEDDGDDDANWEKTSRADIVKKDLINEEDEEKIPWSTSQPGSSSSLGLKIPESILAYGGDSTDSENEADDISTKHESGNRSPKKDISEDEDDEEFATDFFGLKRQKYRKMLPKSTAKTSRVEYLPVEIKVRHQESTLIIPDVSTMSCTSCNRRGHIAMHCTVQSSTGQQKNQVAKRTGTLRELFVKCKSLKNSLNRRCGECGISSNLAHCMDCNVALCDGYGHLRNHLVVHPSHRTLYSYKLQRMLKCQNPQCDIVDIYKLLMCRKCLDKSFSQHYSMINATWSRTGLKNIPNSIACDEHFMWHRMNCGCSGDETVVSTEDLESGTNILISEFYF